MKELVVISGKGGTGKTSVVGAFATLAEKKVLADCDVDAADLYLVLSPRVSKRWPFSGGHEAVIDQDACKGCGRCAKHCRFSAISAGEDNTGRVHVVDPISCEGCVVCFDICVKRAVSMVPSLNGEWFVSDTCYGPMVHARLGIAQENSGKLVSLVRKEARALAVASGRDLLISDGSPGIGCPVMASITGATMVLIVTEPTRSGLHDLKRAAELTRQFNIQAAVCINKFDINGEMSDRIERESAELHLPVIGRIHYDEAVTRAQVRRETAVDYGDGPAARDIKALWEQVEIALGQSAPIRISEDMEARKGQ